MNERERPESVERAEERLEAAQGGTDAERLAALDGVYQELERELER
jgi:hypothetical protein